MSTNKHYKAQMMITVKVIGGEIPLKMEISVPDYADYDKLREILAKIVSILYKELYADISLQQPELV